MNDTTMNDDSSAADSARDEAASALETNVKSRETWLRLLFMVIYGAIVSLAGMVATAIVVLGFLVVLFTGERNRSLMAAGRVVTDYIAEILDFLTFNSEEKPFPFGSEFPAADTPAAASE